MQIAEKHYHSFTLLHISHRYEPQIPWRTSHTHQSQFSPWLHTKLMLIRTTDQDYLYTSLWHTLCRVFQSAISCLAFLCFWPVFCLSFMLFCRLSWLFNCFWPRSFDLCLFIFYVILPPVLIIRPLLTTLFWPMFCLSFMLFCCLSWPFACFWPCPFDLCFVYHSGCFATCPDHLPAFDHTLLTHLLFISHVVLPPVLIIHLLCIMFWPTV